MTKIRICYYVGDAEPLWDEDSVLRTRTDLIDLIEHDTELQKLCHELSSVLETIPEQMILDIDDLNPSTVIDEDLKKKLLVLLELYEKQESYILNLSNELEFFMKPSDSLKEFCKRNNI
ncbi:MAG: hypothetical protein MJZ34_13740 [Paludibacteraceae bacterium]|nr:hypothetical protein [Paludibacteraceae bacterium]